MQEAGRSGRVGSGRVGSIPLFVHTLNKRSQWYKLNRNRVGTDSSKKTGGIFAERGAQTETYFSLANGQHKTIFLYGTKTIFLYGTKHTWNQAHFFV